MPKTLITLASLLLLIFAGCAAQESATTTMTTASTTQHGSYVRSNRATKIIGGKRYVFVPGELGSNLPGRWVPEDSPAAQNAPATQAVDPHALQDFQGGYR